MMFWIVAGAMAALLVVGLLWPLLRPRAGGPAAAEFDRAVYRDQLAEIEQDVKRGLLGPAEAEAARREIARRLLQTEEAGAGRAGAARPWRQLGLILVVALPPALALGLYLRLGTPDLPNMPLAGRDPGGPAEVAMLAERLEARVADNPEDLEARLVLSQVYERSGDYAKAAAHYREVIALLGRQGRPVPGPLHAALGEALVAAEGGRIGREARLAFAAAIEVDPGNSRARYYAGLAMAQDGRLEEAIGVWQSLAEDSPADSPWRSLLREQIARAARELGIDPPAIAEGPDGGGPGASRGPTAGDIEAAQLLSPEERQAFVRSMVDQLAARLDAEPADPDGWLRLARAYIVLGEAGKAGEALAAAEREIAALPEAGPEREDLQRRLQALRMQLP